MTHTALAPQISATPVHSCPYCVDREHGIVRLHDQESTRWQRLVQSTKIVTSAPLRRSPSPSTADVWQPAVSSEQVWSRPAVTPPQVPSPPRPMGLGRLVLLVAALARALGRRADRHHRPGSSPECGNDFGRSGKRDRGVQHDG